MRRFVKGTRWWHWSIVHHIFLTSPSLPSTTNSDEASNLLTTYILHQFFWSLKMWKQIFKNLLWHCEFFQNYLVTIANPIFTNAVASESRSKQWCWLLMEDSNHTPTSAAVEVAENNDCWGMSPQPLHFPKKQREKVRERAFFHEDIRGFQQVSSPWYLSTHHHWHWHSSHSHLQSWFRNKFCLIISRHEILNEAIWFTWQGSLTTSLTQNIAKLALES